MGLAAANTIGWVAVRLGDRQPFSPNPGIITGTHGFRDIAAVHYLLIGVYDSADPKVIEYDLLRAVLAEYSHPT